MFRAAMIGWMLISLMGAAASWAEDEPEEEAPAENTVTKYIHLEPAFVLNYGSEGRMKYLRTEVALRVSSTDAASRVSHHKPYIRNNLVMLLSAQDGDVMNTAQGRESLRKVALDEVRALMVLLEGSPYVDDLYFNNFVVQN